MYATAASNRADYQIEAKSINLRANKVDTSGPNLRAFRARLYFDAATVVLRGHENEDGSSAGIDGASSLRMPGQEAGDGASHRRSRRAGRDAGLAADRRAGHACADAHADGQAQEARLGRHHPPSSLGRP